MFDRPDVWIPAAIVIGTALFNSGVLVATLRIHGVKLKEHSDQFKAHGVEIKDHGEKLIKLLAWHDGFTAGTHRG